MKPRVLCVIPARGGSKRIPKKNHQLLGGASLVDVAYFHATRSGVCDHIVVSSDEDWSPLQTVTRPPELCQDSSDICDAVKHALETVERQKHDAFDYVVTLQPATPLRSANLIAQMVEDMVHARADSAITCAHVVPWTWRIERGQARNDWTPRPYPRSQDCRFHNLQEINTVQIASAATVREGKRWGLPLLIAELPSWATMDIDTPADYEEARCLWPMFSKAMEEWQGYRFHIVHDINPAQMVFGQAVTAAR